MNTRHTVTRPCQQISDCQSPEEKKKLEPFVEYNVKPTLGLARLPLDEVLKRYYGGTIAHTILTYTQAHPTAAIKHNNRSIPSTKPTSDPPPLHPLPDDE